MPERRIKLTDEECGWDTAGTPSSRHVFLELIEDECVHAFNPEKCSCIVARRGIVWTDIVGEING